ncbi:MAG: GNAT family N-acetyltransferase [Desulfobacterales bacterium]|nr:GNAT family N-acetyltransferase [Desulfobacterales bacterium]
MKYRIATNEDIEILAEMNMELCKDENHKNQFKSKNWFQERMATFLSSSYTAVIFELKDSPIAYALFVNHAEHVDTIHLRQIFVRGSVRRQGIGKNAMQILLNKVWPKGRRITVESLSNNHKALSFYKSLGFTDYSVELELKGNDIITN